MQRIGLLRGFSFDFEWLRSCKQFLKLNERVRKRGHVHTIKHQCGNVHRALKFMAYQQKLTRVHNIVNVYRMRQASQLSVNPHVAQVAGFKPVEHVCDRRKL